MCLIKYFITVLPPVNTCPAACLLFSPPGCDWVLLSPCYVETDGDVAGWRELFSRLGVRDGLIIRKERRILTAKELVRRTVLNCYLSYLGITLNSYCKHAIIQYIRPDQDHDSPR